MQKSENEELVRAVSSDLPGIFGLYKAAIAHLTAQGLHFWDFNWYPNADILTQDVEKGDLYVVKDAPSGRIAACVVLNTDFDEQYRNGRWEYETESPFIVHRLCIHPDFQNRGLGKRVMQAAEAEGRARGFTAVRLDAYSGNQASLALYEHLGFRKAGEANWVKGMFWLMEKKL